MGQFTVIRTPAFDLLAADYAREHSKLNDDLDWLAGRLAEAPKRGQTIVWTKKGPARQK